MQYASFPCIVKLLREIVTVYHGCYKPKNFHFYSILKVNSTKFMAIVYPINYPVTLKPLIAYTSFLHQMKDKEIPFQYISILICIFNEK